MRAALRHGGSALAVAAVFSSRQYFGPCGVTVGRSGQYFGRSGAAVCSPGRYAAPGNEQQDHSIPPQRGGGAATRPRMTQHADSDWRPRVDRFARLLGWPRPRTYRHRIPKGTPGCPQGRLIRWHESEPQEGVSLIINEAPTWCAAVYAIRYRLCSCFREFDFHGDLRLDADRLRTLLGIEWFDSPERRREYRQAHPECSGWTWKRIRTQEGVWYFDKTGSRKHYYPPRGNQPNP